MTNTKLRVLGYVRVSQTNGREGDRFISPSEQRQAIERFVASRRHELVDVLVDLDESGVTFERPMFKEALARLDGGEADGLCPARLDRFSRSTLEGLALAQRLRDAGHALLLPDLDLDTSTPTGKAMLAVALAFAQLELDQRRENWGAAQRRAMERGVYPGTTPLGYVRDKDGKMLIDPVAGPALRRVFEGRAAGLSWSKLARQLDVELPRQDGQPWRPATVKAILDSPLYLGRLERTVGGEPMVVEDTHEPLVDRALFEAVQTPGGPAPKHRSLPAMLAGLVRCGSCGGALTRGGERKVRNGKEYRYDAYLCSLRCERMVRISAPALDAYLLGEVYERLANTRHVDASLRNGGGVKLAEAALAEAESERSRVIGVASGIFDSEALAETMRVHQAAVDAARLELARAVSRERAAGPAHADLIETLEQGDDGQRNTILRTKIASVTVKKAGTPGKTGNLAERVRIVWAEEDAAQDAGELGDEPVGERSPVAA